MEHMQFCIRLLRLCGITGGTIRPFAVYFLFLLFMCFMVYGQICFVMLGEPTIVQLSMVSYVTVTIGGIYVQLLICVWNRKEVWQFVQYLHNYIVTFSKYYQTTEYFQQIEATVTFYSKWFSVVLVSSVSLYILQPVIGWVIAIGTGSVTEDTFRAPFRDMYQYFDERKSPAREILFALNVFNLLVPMTAYLTVDLLFLNTCFYVVSLYNQLKIRLNNLDGLEKKLQRSRAIKECVLRHTEIFEIIQMFNDIFGGIIFVQFTYSMFSICTCVLTAIYSDPSSLLLVGLNFCVLTSDLCLFCTAGMMVLTAGAAISDCVYQLNWSEYSPNERKMLQMIMVRAQMPCGFGAYNYFFCSHETFSKILSKVFSALAFLKKVVETNG